MDPYRKFAKLLTDNIFIERLGLILKFSSLNLLHKGLLMHDWVFRLGLGFVLLKITPGKRPLTLNLEVNKRPK